MCQLFVRANYDTWDSISDVRRDAVIEQNAASNDYKIERDEEVLDFDGIVKELFILYRL